jgi:hypothetical protein
MTEVNYSRTIFLDEVSVSDAGGALWISMWQSHGAPRPFTIALDDAHWLLSVAEASAVADAVRSCENYIALRARRGEAPKEHVAFATPKPISFDDGTASVFEVGTTAEQAHFFVGWAGRRLVPGPTKRDTLFIAFARMGEMAAQLPDPTGQRRVQQLLIDPATYRSPLAVEYWARPLPWERSS